MSKVSKETQQFCEEFFSRTRDSNQQHSSSEAGTIPAYLQPSSIKLEQFTPPLNSTRHLMLHISNAVLTLLQASAEKPAPTVRRAKWPDSINSSCRQLATPSAG